MEAEGIRAEGDQRRVEQRNMWIRVVVTLILVICIIYLVVLSSLATHGARPFKHARGFESLPSLATCMMPANYYQHIRIFLHFSFIFIGVYALVVLLKVVAIGLEERYSESLPVSIIIMLVVSLNFNLGWLFAVDNLNASGGFILALFLFLSNGITLACATNKFSACGQFLYHDSIIDFWMGVSVINFLSMYTAWSLLEFFMSLTVFMVHQVKMEMDKVCQGMIIVLLLFTILWFIAENSRLTLCFNTVVLHYFVLVYYAAAVYSRQVQESSRVMHGLLITNVVVAVVVLFFRPIIQFKRNRRNKIYGPDTATGPTHNVVPA